MYRASSLFRSVKSASIALPTLLGAAVACLPAVARAQSAANWLAVAPIPSRSLLFHETLSAASALSDTSLGSPVLSSDSLEGAAALPEAPEPQIALEPKPKHGTDPSEKIARKATMVIPSDWHAQRLTAAQKVSAGLQDTYTFEQFASFFLAAGWEQLTNGSPNYGTDKGAFGERLGAAAIRGTSQTVFSEVILAPAFHEDARYYVDGPQHSLIHRTVYAVTRPLITRTDSGKSTINAALLLGYAGSSALTPLYYPNINHNFHDVASVFGGGIGGAALGYFVSEFSQDALRALHLHRAP